MKHKNIIAIAAVTVGLLLIPLVLQLIIGTGVDGQGFNWQLGDFIIMGVLVFVFGLLVDVAMRKAARYRAAAILLIVGLFLWLWIELAVGLFTNWGS